MQGVGFRPFVYRTAVELSLAGHVANDSLGVTVELQGPVGALDEFGRRLVADAPPLARLEAVSVEVMATHPDGDDDGFRIVDSRAQGAPAVAVSVDVATCADCLRELFDPTDRRFAYPFINCTNCGPRYTIIRSIPYDRASTTMSSFPMCDACHGEYHDPADRRFHAEPNACGVCGPRLRLQSGDGTVLAERHGALDAAIHALVSGQVLAVKGLGGFHLAVDAANDGAVAELRRRKARDDKPFALMVGGSREALALCDLSPEALRELESLRRPIVLARRRPDAAVSGAVAPGLPELGLMLAYTPLHHLLMAGVGRGLVMTSGNLSDEPIAHADTDAVERLGPMVDRILTHDRGIHIRCDDSVVRARTMLPAGARGAATHTTQMVRRSRGYAPEPLGLVHPSPHHVLAVGAELKNTVAVAKGANVIASHHIGDLEHLAAYQSFLQAVDHLCHLTGVTPEVVAHDLHPEYLSTKFALELDLPLVGVQHHHAHVASCLAEHGREEAVLGVAFDGLGMGTDGTIWGGEFLVADLDGFERVGHLRTVPLVGGNHAVREPWRMALAWAHAALGAEAAEAYGRSVDDRWQAVMSMLERPDALITSSAGRLFDAVAALLGLRSRVTYEGQAAIELEACAASEPLVDGHGYEVEISTTGEGPAVLDPAPMIVRLVADRDFGVPPALISARFHAGLGAGVAGLAADLAGRRGLGTVALSGGVFQNARLTAVVERALTERGLEVLVHRRLPPNDGGVSVGQAAVAAHRRDGSVPPVS